MSEKMFRTATRSKLRFSASMGYVTTEDLWDLSLIELNSIAKDLNAKLKNEKIAREEAVDNKAKKKRLIDILDRKQNAALENLTQEEIEAKIKEIDGV